MNKIGRTTSLHGASQRKLPRLKTPISKGLPALCASSTSLRVGDVRHCIVKLLAPNRTVLSTLMIKCNAVFHCLTFLQSPTYNSPTPPIAPYTWRTITVKTMLRIITPNEIDANINRALRQLSEAVTSLLGSWKRKRCRSLLASIDDFRRFDPAANLRITLVSGTGALSDDHSGW